MKEDESALDKAVEAIRSERIPAGPSQELVNTTVTRLTLPREKSEEESSSDRFGLWTRFGATGGIARFAAAAALFILAGYAVGRVSAPQPPDMKELEAALEPAIRHKIIAQLRNDLQSGLATCYDRLSVELGQRQTQEMAGFAAQTLAASSSATNELLAALVESVDASQQEQRQWFTAAIEQIERRRLRDNAQLASFAVQTDDEMERMKAGVAQLLSSYGLLDGQVTNEIDNPNSNDEGTEK